MLFNWLFKGLRITANSTPSCTTGKSIIEVRVQKKTRSRFRERVNINETYANFLRRISMRAAAPKPDRAKIDGSGTGRTLNPGIGASPVLLGAPVGSATVIKNAPECPRNAALA